MLRRLADRLWTAQLPARAHGVSLGERLSVIALTSGELFLHGPVRLDAELRRRIDELGAVRYLCAPNLLRRDLLAPWRHAYPDAEVLVAPGGAGGARLVELGGAPLPGYAADLDQLRFEGIPSLGEVVFLHRPSRTLLLADLAVTIPRAASLAVRAYLRLSLGGRRFGPTRDMRWLCQDRQAARASLDRLLEWDFERVVVRHGDVLDRGGPAALRRGFQWLRSEPAWWQ